MPSPVEAPRSVVDLPSVRAPLGSLVYTTEALGLGPKIAGGYSLSRWAEDWSYLRDRSKRNDVFDPLKFIPLDREGNVYLTLSNEERLRFDSNSNPGLKKGATASDAFKFRSFLGADLHFGSSFRVYGELADAQYKGRNIIATGANQNDLIVQQLFAEVHRPVGQAEVGARVGRQDFLDGPIQLISNQENPNIHTTFDGVRGYINGRIVRLDAFALDYVKQGFGAFDDPTDHDQHFRGIVGGVLLSPIDRARVYKLFLNPFFFNYRGDDIRRGGFIGDEDRRIYGARLWGTIGSVTFDWSADRQDGRFANRDINAYQIFLIQSIAFPKAPWKPELGLHLDFSSGGGSFDSGSKLKAATYLFGTVPFYSYSTLLGASNIREVAPNLSVFPVPKLKIALEYDMYWRDSQHDAVYNGTGGFFARTAGVRGAKIGNQPRANITYQINKHLSLTARFEYLRAGSALKNAGYAGNMFTATWLTFRF
ncbi:alginate export family protein [Sphingomonas chungangi]|uniref:alginate export family protein n=1 Tax=Sphingomonas chungangi TaxID=2683589 RepID=UPI0013652C83